MSKLNSYSYTTLSTYHGCPHALKLKRDRVTPIIPSYVTIGGLAHDAIERYIGACLNKMASTDPDEVIEACLRIDPKYRAEVEEILTEFAARHDCLEFIQAETEVEFAFDAEWRTCGWSDWDICRFRGKADMIEVRPGVVRITDWKTGHKIPPKAELEADPQLRIYAALAAESYQADVYEIAFDYVRRGYVFETTFTREEALDMRDLLTEVMGDIDMDHELKPAPGPKCGGCFYKGGCKAYRSLSALTAIPEDAGDLARLYYALKARTEEIEVMLREKLGTGGSIDVGDGQEVAFAPVAGRTSIPETFEAVNALAKILGKLPMDLVPALSINKTAVEKLCKAAGHPEYIQAFLKEHAVIGAPGDRMVVRKREIPK